MAPPAARAAAAAAAGLAREGTLGGALGTSGALGVTGRGVEEEEAAAAASVWPSPFFDHFLSLLSNMLERLFPIWENACSEGQCAQCGRWRPIRTRNLSDHPPSKFVDEKLPRVRAEQCWRAHLADLLAEVFLLLFLRLVFTAVVAFCTPNHSCWTSPTPLLCLQKSAYPPGRGHGHPSEHSQTRGGSESPHCVLKLSRTSPPDGTYLLQPTNRRPME